MARDYSKSAGNKMISAAIQKAEEVQGDNKKMNIPIELIDVNPDNEFLMGYEENPEIFAEQIEKEGFYGVINVFAKKNGRYEIFSGHRRFFALQRNGQKQIPCIVFPEPDEATKYERLMGSNIHSRTMDPLHLARCIRAYKEQVLRARNFKGDTNQEAAKFFGFSRSKVVRYEAILSMIPEIQKLAENPTFPYGILYKIREEKLNEKDQYEVWKRVEREIASSEDREISSAKFKLILGDVIRQREIRKINEAQKKSAKELIVENNPDMVDRIYESESITTGQPEWQLENNDIERKQEHIVPFVETVAEIDLLDIQQAVPIKIEMPDVEEPIYGDDDLKKSYELIRDIKIQNAQFKSKAMAKEMLKEIGAYIDELLKDV